MVILSEVIKMNQNKDKPIIAFYAGEYKDLIKQSAKKENRSVSNFIVTILKKHFEGRSVEK